ncbi:type III restriction endonuclease subunit M [Vibrio cholerae]|nr:type III restriction endonuclease subunit M [Vibrio cholerae]
MTHKPEVMSGESLDIAAQRRDELKQLFPGVFTETKDADGNVVSSIDFERLKAELGTFSDIYEGRRERYGMEWPGKRDCMKVIQEPSRATLKPCPDESVDWDTTKNLFIEGDNLEVLKLLQKSYYGKVKMIYIDPPYNTGNEFIYPDNYQETLDTYLAYAGLLDDEGKKFTTNTSSEGRFHSKWLNMIYPRIFLARNLLTEDGLIMVSIDDNEYIHLREVMDSIFGEENFAGTMIWQGGRKNDSKRLSVVHDYVVVYVKNESLLQEMDLRWREKKNGLDEVYAKAAELRELHSEDFEAGSKELREWFKGLPDGSPAKEHSHYKFLDGEGVYYGDNISSPNYRENLIFEWKGYAPPKNGWRYNREAMSRLHDQGLLIYPEDKSKRIQYKRYLHHTEDWAPSTHFYKDRRAASKSLTQLMNGNVFDFPKDTDVIARFITTFTSDSDIVLDFFAGSGSTGEALLKANSKEMSSRKFILVQLPEKLDATVKKQEEAFKLCTEIGVPANIAELSKERLRRAILQFKEKPECPSDLGFRVFKLCESNFKQWSVSSELNIDNLQQQLDIHVDNVLSDDFESVLYELLLKSGFELVEDVERIHYRVVMCILLLQKRLLFV